MLCLLPFGDICFTHTRQHARRPRRARENRLLIYFISSLLFLQTRLRFSTSGVFFRPRRARENRPLINIFFHLFYSYKRGRSLRRTVCISGHVALEITVLLFIFFHLLILTNEAEVFSSTTKTSRHYDLGKFLYRCATHTVCDLAVSYNFECSWRAFTFLSLLSFVTNLLNLLFPFFLMRFP